MATVECKIRRKKGSNIDIDGVIYKFRPDKSGAHVCKVDNKTHLQRFLMIPEAYKIAGADDVEPIKKVEDKEPTVDDDTTKFELETLDQWTNSKLLAWARSLGMNEKSKESIADVALDQYDIKLDKRKQPAGMLRQLAEFFRDDVEQAEQEEE